MVTSESPPVAVGCGRVFQEHNLRFRKALKKKQSFLDFFFRIGERIT